MDIALSSRCVMETGCPLPRVPSFPSQESRKNGVILPLGPSPGVILVLSLPIFLLWNVLALLPAVLIFSVLTPEAQEEYL